MQWEFPSGNAEVSAQVYEEGAPVLADSALPQAMNLHLRVCCTGDKQSNGSHCKLWCAFLTTGSRPCTVCGSNWGLQLFSPPSFLSRNGEDLRCVHNTKSLCFYPNPIQAAVSLYLDQGTGPWAELAATGTGQGTAALPASNLRTLHSINDCSFATRRLSEFN